MIGIYKITSPTGKVYIGQSFDIVRRENNYSNINAKQPKSLINKSILKYGWINHAFKLIHELPDDIDKETLTQYEQIYMDAYRETGLCMLNMCPAAGSPKGIKRPIEQIERHKKLLTGRPSPKRGTTLSEEVKQKIRLKRALQTNVKGPTGITPWNKGKKLGTSSWNKGIPLSQSAKDKIREKLLGSKLSPETIAKRTATLKKNGVKRKWSAESRKRQSERMKGMPSIMKGRKHSEETKMKISLIQKGKTRKPHSEETKRKIGLARRNYFEKQASKII